MYRDLLGQVFGSLRDGEERVREMYRARHPQSHNPTEWPSIERPGPDGMAGTVVDFDGGGGDGWTRRKTTLHLDSDGRAWRQETETVQTDGRVHTLVLTWQPNGPVREDERTSDPE